MMTVAVVRVVSTHPPTQGAFVEINAADFDPSVHTLYTEGAEPAAELETTIKRGPGRPRKHQGATDGNR